MTSAEEAAMVTDMAATPDGIMKQLGEEVQKQDLITKVIGGNRSAWTQEGCVGKGRHKATA
ncbi:hypothetical protein NQ318_014923 [Aromia moschata]|uniref:Uncharacterized protein n=1 Tax=Aromia moschata TaxID=1265417 RepID=A0AAV8XKU5_9CUCU|nr:hypothetical protein NQ318_014923 [Aromia moschata]